MHLYTIFSSAFTVPQYLGSECRCYHNFYPPFMRFRLHLRKAIRICIYRYFDAM